MLKYNYQIGSALNAEHEGKQITKGGDGMAAKKAKKSKKKKK